MPLNKQKYINNLCVSGTFYACGQNAYNAIMHKTTTEPSEQHVDGAA